MNTTGYVVEAVGLVKRRGDFTLGPLDLRVPRGQRPAIPVRQ